MKPTITICPMCATPTDITKLTIVGPGVAAVLCSKCIQDQASQGAIKTCDKCKDWVLFSGLYKGDDAKNGICKRCINDKYDTKTYTT